MTWLSKLVVISLLAGQIVVTSSCANDSLLEVDAVKIDDSAITRPMSRAVNDFTLAASATGDWRIDAQHDRIAMILQDCASGETLAIARGINASFNNQANVSTIMSDRIRLDIRNGMCMKLQRLRMLFPSTTNQVSIRMIAH